MRIFAHAFLSLLIGITLAGCAQLGSRLESALPAPLTLPQAGSQVDNAAVPTGSMLVAVSKRGLLSVLNESGWQKAKVPSAFTDNAYCVPSSSQVGFDAQAAWAQCMTTVTSANGQDWSNAVLPLAGKLVFGPDGRRALVAPGQVTISAADGTASSFRPDRTLGLRTFPTEAAVFTPDGTLWLAGQPAANTTQLVSFNGQQWQRYGEKPSDLDLTPNDMPRHLAVGPDGTLYATSHNQLFQFDGSKFTLALDESQIALTYKGREFLGMINDLLVMPNGDVWLASSEGVFVWNGRFVQLFDRGDGLPAKDTRGLALDTRGRVWAATAYGLALYERGKWQAIVAATSGIADPDLVALAVRGAPSLPPALNPAKTATIIGHIASASGPTVADAPVLLCSEAPGVNHRHGEPLPCSEQYLTRQVRTNANGDYRFDDVPVGAYTIVTNYKGTWYFAIRLPERDWQPIVAIEPGLTARMDMGLP